jgi:hypothetical protein
MAEDLNKKVDELEAAAKKYASKDTVISIGGYEFTPAKLMVAFTIVSSSLGGLYGTFEIYKDYMGMKKKIADYITPDLSEFDKRLAVIEQNSAKTADYTRDIKVDLKNDLRRNETVTEQIEQDVKTVQREMRADQDRTRAELEKLRREVDSKIQKAIDNPLANK